MINNFQITNATTQNDLDEVMGNDDERFTDNCGWPGNERVTVSMFFSFSLQLSLALLGVFYILTLLNVACFQHNKDIFFFQNIE